MRVLFLTSSLYIGGAERWILSLARHFSPATDTAGVVNCGPLVDASMLRECRQLTTFHQANITIDAQRKMHVYSRDANRLLCDLAADCDVIVSWGLPALAQIVATIDKPVVEVAHADRVWPSQVQLVKESVKGATHLAAVSEPARLSFPDEYHDRVTVIVNGAQLERVAPSRPDARQRQREAWGIAGDEKVLLYVGRFQDIKAPERLIPVMRHLPDNWKLVYAGQGLAGEETKLRAMCQQTIPGRVVFQRPQLLVGDFFAGCDCVCQPSQHEGHSLVMLEAMLGRAPFVSTAFDSALHMKQQHGLLFPIVPQPGDPQKLATAILAAARGKFVQTCFETAWRHYTSVVMARQWEEYLGDVVAEYRAAYLNGARMPKLTSPGAAR